MYKIVRADKDAYITDRIISGVRRVSASVGAAATLDLFKLYGMSFSGSTPNVELSRLLIHFDLSPLRTLMSASRLAINEPSFACELKLRDVYGGQTTPADFTVEVFPLSRSFDEGFGRDIVQYSDEDVCSFVSSSRAQGAWLRAGCMLSGSDESACDFITGSHGINLRAAQNFTTGFEDLSIDVTRIVSATLAGVVPDAGFRISLSSSHESDAESYFVKRFAARHAHDPAFHPRLCARFDDSVQDDSTALTLDDDFTLVLRSYSKGRPANLLSGSTAITGSNCLLLKLRTEISGGYHELSFTGSQLLRAGARIMGVYSASIHASSSIAAIRTKLDQSGSLRTTPIWSSFDGSVAYLTGSALTIVRRQGSTTQLEASRYVATTSGIPSDVNDDETLTVRVHVSDPTAQLTVVKRPLEHPGIIVRDAFYAVRDAETDERIVPFDRTLGSTRLSSDSSSMLFDLDASNLVVGRSYVIDIMLVIDGHESIIRDASHAFRVHAG